MEAYAQTGFQSACSEFSEHSLSLNQRYDILNPAKVLITLTVDAPLFGMSQGNLLLIDCSRKPKNGDLILIEDALRCGIYRYEFNYGKPYLWPGNLAVDDELESLIGGVVILLIKELISLTGMAQSKRSYLENVSQKESRHWKKDNAK